MADKKTKREMLAEERPENLIETPQKDEGSDEEKKGKKKLLAEKLRQLRDTYFQNTDNPTLLSLGGMIRQLENGEPMRWQLKEGIQSHLRDLRNRHTDPEAHALIEECLVDLTKIKMKGKGPAYGFKPDSEQRKR